MKWLSEHFELTRGGNTGNIQPMEGLRGLAVFLVFLVHYVTLSTPWFRSGKTFAAVTEGIHAAGNTGVDLFFVLSGYLIYGALIQRPVRYWAFMRRRYIRLYPAFTAVFLCYVGLSAVFPSESKIPAGAGPALAYLGANYLLLPGLFPIEPMITVAWSLSYELFYYLTMPLVVAWLHLSQRSIRWRTGLFAASAGVFLLVSAVVGGPVRMVMFLAGILLHEALAAERRPGRMGHFALAGLIAGLLIATLHLPGPAGQALKTAVLFAAFFVVCWACFAEPASRLARGLAWTPLRWLGNMSYSYYLLHGLALKAAFLALGRVVPATGNWPAWAFPLLGAFVFALTLIPTATLFLVIERRFSLNVATKASHTSTDRRIGEAAGNP